MLVLGTAFISASSTEWARFTSLPTPHTHTHTQKPKPMLATETTQVSISL